MALVDGGWEIANESNNMIANGLYGDCLSVITSIRSGFGAGGRKETNHLFTK